MIDRPLRTNYSADVKLWIEANGHKWPIAKLGPDRFMTSERIEIPPGDAVIIMTVDGWERRWNVELPDGACYFDKNVRIRYLPDAVESVPHRPPQ